MRVFWDERQRLHAPARELHNGGFTPYAEHCGRVESMLAALGATHAVADRGEDPLLRVHPGPYLDVLKSAFADWKAAGRPGDASGYVWPVVGRRPLDLDRIDARLGQFSMDASTPIAEGTNILDSANPARHKGAWHRNPAPLWKPSGTSQTRTSPFSTW